MCSLMYRLSMKPQYENCCNCCVVSLFSPWVTPGPSLHFVSSVILFFFFSSPSPLPLVHAQLLSVSLFAVSFLPLLSPAHCLFFCSLCHLSLQPTLHPSVLYSLSPLQPQRPDLLPLLAEERGFCLPPAVVTWRHR